MNNLMITPIQQQQQQELNPVPLRRHRTQRNRGYYRNVRLPRRGLLFDKPPQPKFLLAVERRIEEFFPRLFRVNPALAQTLLYGHFKHSEWLDCNLANIDIFVIDLNFVDKSFVEVLGWNYLEYCEEVMNNVEIKPFQFQHFHWWFKIVKPFVDRHCCGR